MGKKQFSVTVVGLAIAALFLFAVHGGAQAGAGLQIARCTASGRMSVHA